MREYRRTLFLQETPSEDASSAKNVENLWRVPVQVSCGDSSSIYFMPWNYYFLLGISDLGAQPCWFALHHRRAENSCFVTCITFAIDTVWPCS